MKNNHELIQSLKNELIVSCQALPGEPLYKEEGGVMVLMAQAAIEAGAAGIRAQGVTDIKQIKDAFDIPVIGIIKREYPSFDSYITVTMKEVDELVEAGSDIIAMDATFAKRGDGKTINGFFKEVKEKYPDQLFMADISTLEEGLNAAEIGFDLIGTTMNGYTEETKEQTDVNFQLMKDLVEQTDRFIVAEGKLHYPEQLKKAFETGIHTAVVGGAITRPLDIAKRFIHALPNN
ncbi:N-acetylmannosamine-6-phosphate 2-epimerase [Alkalibacterium iburiense]|uniref:Putative N-acetylmannosamine-6-phosphate 2-epimerase n=1 Tax=Alkalibacterium iburiense TaxID=290589 RepID=A0ABN0XJN9_9LACT